MSVLFCVRVTFLVPCTGHPENTRSNTFMLHVTGWSGFDDVDVIGKHKYSFCPVGPMY